MLKRVQVLILLCCFSFLNAAFGQDAQESSNEDTLNITINNSEIITFEHKIKRVSVADPSIVSVKVISPKEVAFSGAAVGVTEISFQFKGDVPEQKRTVFVEHNDYQVKQIAATVDSILKGYAYAKDVEFEIKRVWLKPETLVQRHIDETGAQYDSAMNQEVGLDGDTATTTTTQVSSKVTTTNGNLLLILKGSVDNEAQKNQIQSILTTLGVSILNTLEVRQPQEIRLSVRIAEVVKGNPFSFGISSTVSSNPNPNNALELVVQSFFGSTLANAANITSTGSNISGVISILEENNLARILAKPELTVKSGETAEFLAGGEVPIPVTQATSGAVTVDYKEYGVRLRFNPVITVDGKIKMAVEPEISNLDYSNSVGSYPGLRSRKISTTVTLAPEESFMIGGLIQNDISSNISKIPLLGDIPILGALFRSTSFDKNETELAVIVTPYLAKPSTATDLTLPGANIALPSKGAGFLTSKAFRVLSEQHEIEPDLLQKIGLETP